MYTEYNSAFVVGNNIGAYELCRLSEEVRGGKSNVVISSSGGTAEALFVVGPLFRGRDITTIGDGPVSSAALDIFLMGSKRLAIPDSKFFFHRASYEHGGRKVRAREAFMLAEIFRHDNQPLSASESLSYARTMSEIDIICARLIASRTRLEADRVMELMDGEGTCLSLCEALLYGFVDDVISPDLIVV
ncbi:MAG: hypothetical protein HGB18_04405 [Candidatus Moranbacteria bacterium]|nr:hypothetical protein [Candidatus Moranbacteria bacterium]